MMNSESENLTGRIATAADFAQLAEMNRQLIRDEGHRNAMSALELEHRMKNWLAGEYQAASRLFGIDCLMFAKDCLNLGLGERLSNLGEISV